MKVHNIQVLDLLAQKFGKIGGQAYEVDGELWLDIKDDVTADNVFEYLTHECPLDLPFGSFSVQRTSNIQAPRKAI